MMINFATQRATAVSMRDFVIVTFVLLLFLGLGIAMGTLIVPMLARRRGPKGPDGGRDDGRPPRRPGG